MEKIVLNGKWKVRGIAPDGKEIDFYGTVPGSALNDVLAFGIEKENDIFWRDNAEAFQKYENYDWVYSKSFEVTETVEKAVLTFQKLDTYCDVYLNGKHLGHCDNGFISHSFTVGNIKKGENIIEVYFCSPISATRGKKPRHGAFTTVDRLYTRRTQCTYGWDWTMRFVTCGIGDVCIKTPEDGIKIKTAYVYTKNIDEYSAAIGIDVYTEEFDKGEILCYEIYDNEDRLVRALAKYCEEDFARLDLDIKAPKLWYPLGYGEQNLYKLIIKTGERELYNTKFGIRTVKILELPDEEGSENYNKCIELKKCEASRCADQNTEFSGFILVENGIRIMCKGANWVPCEPFSKGNTDEKITAVLELAAQAGVNMIRVWGGGSFETEHFYDECSRLGIMVTQDFLMACGQYPEDEEWFIKQLQAEARYVAELIRNKPCLMWWTGDNENATGGCDTDAQYNGRTSAYKGIAPVLYRLDPYRRFLPSSPYGGKKYASKTTGTTHNTEFLKYFFQYIDESDAKDYKDYFKQYRARFIAEEPCLGAVCEESLKRFMTDEDICGEKLDMWLYHTKNNPSLKKEIFEYILIFAQKLLGEFKNPQDRLFKLQYLQYEWVRASLEQARREKWFCSGIIYWMLNDCWPAAAGWALIDYYTMPKAGYYSFKRCAKQVMLSLDLTDGVYKLYVSNDGKDENVAIRWYAISNQGEVVKASDEVKISIAENTSAIGLEIKENDVPEDCFIVAELETQGGKNDRTFYKKGNLEICNCNDKIEILTKDDNCVKVKAKTYIHSVELKGDAVFEDNYFSLLPGEEREIFVKDSSAEKIKIDAYTLSC